MRLLIPLLLVANLAALAWWQGWLDPWLGVPRESARLERQIEPRALRLVPLPGGALESPGATGDTGVPSRPAGTQ